MKILLQNNIDLIHPLPKIVFVGNQSSDKSSLIEAISRIKVPRVRDMCTRYPMEVRLIQAVDNEPWSCTISWHFADDFAIEDVPQRAPEMVLFRTISFRKDVEGIIVRAQLAILNPSTNYEEFRNMPAEEISAHDVNELTFSKNSVIVEIMGETVDLTVSVPGIIANTMMVTPETE